MRTSLRSDYTSISLRNVGRTCGIISAPNTLNMASSSFRDSMNQLGWSRREQTASTSKPSGIYGTLSKLNPFGNEGYVRLPTHESGEAPGAPLPAPSRREEEEGWFARTLEFLVLLRSCCRHHSGDGAWGSMQSFEPEALCKTSCHACAPNARSRIASSRTYIRSESCLRMPLLATPPLR